MLAQPYAESQGVEPGGEVRGLPAGGRNAQDAARAGGVERVEAWSRIDPGLVDYLMESVWGGILSRPGLNRRDREIATLAALCAMDKRREVEYHVHGALAAGLSKAEILEMAVYAGVPACVNGLHTVGKVFRDNCLLSQRPAPGSPP